jgi:hypothetical protein
MTLRSPIIGALFPKRAASYGGRDAIQIPGPAGWTFEKVSFTTIPIQ